jgi:hypothetical protein
MLVERTYLVTYMYQPDTSYTSLRCDTEKYSLMLHNENVYTEGKIAEYLLDKINRSNYFKYHIALVNFWMIDEKETDTTRL